MVPGDGVFDKANPFPLDCVGEDNAWAALLERHLAESPDKISNIITVNSPHAVAECLEFVFEGFKWADFFCWPSYLEAIPVYDHDQIVQVIMARGQRCLPIRSLRKFAVSQQNKNPVRSPVLLASQGHAYRERKAVAQGACIVFDTANLASGMANQVRLVTIQCGQVIFGEETFVCQHYVKRFHAVAFALDVPVPVGIIKTLRRDIKDVVVQDIQDIEA